MNMDVQINNMNQQQQQQQPQQQNFLFNQQPNQRMHPGQIGQINQPFPPQQQNNGIDRRAQAINAQLRMHNQSQSRIYQKTILLLSSWKLNIFLLSFNLAMLLAYVLIIYNKNLKDQTFTIDSILDPDRVPAQLLWFASFLICQLFYISAKCLESLYLEWKPVPLNPIHQRPGFHNPNNNNNANVGAGIDEDQMLREEFQNRSFILEKCFTHNFFHHLFIYWLVNQKQIFVTSFEFLVFLITYIFFTLMLALKELTLDYIKKMIETQISFSSALALQKSEIFSRRINKLKSFFACQIIISTFSLCFLIWFFFYSNYLLLALLLYPGIGNLIEIIMTVFNFKFQLSQALSQKTSDEQIILKIHTNLILHISRQSLDLIQYTILIFQSSVAVGLVPIQIYITHSLIKQVMSIITELEKYKKFNNFLQNLNNDYPLVIFGVQNPQRENERAEHEECAICKEQMVQARKFPCNHCFHQFCIMQLIDSGSKLCPICRAEFQVHRPNNNNNNNNQQRQAGGLRSLFSFNFGGFFPQVSIRVFSGRVPLTTQAGIERVREIFPYLTQAQIIQELRLAGGHIDQAIINISDNVQRRVYQDPQGGADFQ